MNTARGSPQLRLVSSVAMLILVIGGVWYYAGRRTGELFDIGVNAHVQCAIAGIYPAPTQGLGDKFAPMLQPVLAAATDALGSAALVSADRCTVADRAYVHIVLRRGRESTLISVILTQRGDQEDFPRLPTALHTGSRDGYSVAAFESGAYLAYIISTLPGQQNRELAGRLEPIVDRFAGT
jgi:hypothetical protein